MDGSGRRGFLELELSAVQKLYDGEKSRRETVRTSLAIPFAAVAFIVSSMGTLVRLARSEAVPTATGALGWASLGAAALAIALLALALVLIWRIDYAAVDIDGVEIDLSTQALSVERELEEAMPDPETRRREAEFAAIQGAIASYAVDLQRLRASNDANLLVQARVLRSLVICISAVVAAVALALADAIIH